MKKIFDLDGIYNSENDCIWAVNGKEANRRGGKKQQGKFSEKVVVWLAVCSEGVASLVLFEKGSLGHHRYIKEVLPRAPQDSKKSVPFCLMLLASHPVLPH